MKHRFATFILAASMSGSVTLAAAQQAPSAPAGGSLVQERLSGFSADAAKLSAMLDDNRRSLADIRAEWSGWSAELHGIVGRINARLQVGTTPGNPDLVAQYQQAQSTLAGLDATLAKASHLSVSLADTKALADYLKNSIQGAFTLSGATDAEHQQLVQLQSTAAAAAEAVKPLITATNHEMDQEAAALDREHRDLVMLRHAIGVGTALGGNLANVRGARGSETRE